MTLRADNEEDALNVFKREFSFDEFPSFLYGPSHR